MGWLNLVLILLRQHDTASHRRTLLLLNRDLYETRMCVQLRSFDLFRGVYLSELRVIPFRLKAIPFNLARV